jgi:hypothetical protein
MSDFVLQTHRFLEGGNPNATDDTTNGFYDQTTDAPALDDDDSNTFGNLVLAALVIAAVLVAWHSCKRWRLQRERDMLQIQSSRADAVLGDMQMVPADDEYDEDDPELL